MKSLMVRFLTLSLALALLAPVFGEVQAQRPHRESDSASSSSALVSGAYRIVIHQTATSVDPDSLGIEGSDPVIASLVDVTNLGVPAEFDPSIVSIGTYEASPLEVANGTSADNEASTDASIHVGESIDGNFAVAENSTIRLVLVFPLQDIEDDSSLGFRVGDQVASLDQTVVDELSVADAPELQPTMELRIADVTGAPGSGKLSIVYRDGETAEIDIAAIETPEAGTTSIPGCFYNESSAAITAMTGGTVWLEEDVDGFLVWINNPSMGIFDLMQAKIVQEGFGGVSSSDDSAYSSWLKASTDWAQSEGAGLWTDCTSASGEWKVAPTAAPEPTKSPDEIRAEYQWVDTRDLAIRPGSFEGQKIAVAGTVFNIDVEDGFTGMQIWLDGGSEAAVIGYYGDTVGIYEGTWITVYGIGAGKFEGTNAFGGPISQPLIVADIVDW